MAWTPLTFAQSAEKPKNPQKCFPTIDWSTKVKESIKLEIMPHIDWKTGQADKSKTFSVIILDQSTMLLVEDIYKEGLTNQCGRAFDEKKDKKRLADSQVEYIFQNLKYLKDKRQDKILYKEAEKLVKDFHDSEDPLNAFHSLIIVDTATDEKDPYVFIVDGVPHKIIGCLVTIRSEVGPFKDEDFFNAFAGNIFKSRNLLRFMPFFLEYLKWHEIYHCPGGNEYYADCMAIIRMIIEHPAYKEDIYEFAAMLRDARYIANFAFGTDMKYLPLHYYAPFKLNKIINSDRQKDIPEHILPQLTPTEHQELIRKLLEYKTSPSPFSAENKENSLRQIPQPQTFMEADNFKKSMDFLKGLDLKKVAENLQDKERAAVLYLNEVIKRFESGDYTRAPYPNRMFNLPFDIESNLEKIYAHPRYSAQRHTDNHSYEAAIYDSSPSQTAIPVFSR